MHGTVLPDSITWSWAHVGTFAVTFPTLRHQWPIENRVMNEDLYD